MSGDTEREALLSALEEVIDQDVRLLVLATGTTLADFERHLPDVRRALAVRMLSVLPAHDERVKERERVRVTQDLTVEFFDRFKATGSISTVLVRGWWSERISDAVAVREASDD